MSTATAPRALPVAPATRPRTLLIGSGLATGAMLMLFAGLFGVYFSARDQAIGAGEQWFPEGAISLVPGGMMMTTLAMSVVTVQWAVYSVARNDRAHAVLALAVTAVFGAATVNQQVFYWKDIALPIDASRAALLLWVITGAFVAMLLAGMAFLAVMAIRAFGSSDTSRQSDGMVAAAIFWYALVLVYFVIWYGIYISK